MDKTKEMRERVNAIEVELDALLQLIFEEGKSYAELFERAREKAKKSGKLSDLSNIGTRVRRVGNSVSAEWNMKWFYKSPTSKKRKPGSKYIRKTSPEGYSKDIFKSQPEWVKHVGSEVESRYQDIRRQSAIQSAMRKKLAEFERIIQKCEAEDGGT